MTVVRAAVMVPYQYIFFATSLTLRHLCSRSVKSLIVLLPRHPLPLGIADYTFTYLPHRRCLRIERKQQLELVICMLKAFFVLTTGNLTESCVRSPQV